MKTTNEFFTGWLNDIKENPEQTLNDLIAKYENIPTQVDGLLAGLRPHVPNFVEDFYRLKEIRIKKAK